MSANWAHGDHSARRREKNTHSGDKEKRKRNFLWQKGGDRGTGLKERPAREMLTVSLCIAVALEELTSKRCSASEGTRSPTRAEASCAKICSPATAMVLFPGKKFKVCKTLTLRELFPKYHTPSSQKKSTEALSLVSICTAKLSDKTRVYSVKHAIVKVTVFYQLIKAISGFR